jgi:hypothetical protein
VTSRVTRVGGQQHLSTTGDFLSDLVGVDVVVILLRERNGDGRNLPKVSNDSTASNADQAPSSTLTFLNSVSISEYAE